MNWINTIERIEKIKILIEQNDNYYRSLVGNEYIADNFGTVVKIDNFDKETLMFKLSLVDGYRIWWDGAEDFLRNVVSKQYLYKVEEN